MNGLMLNIIIFFTALEIISGDSDGPRNRNRGAPKSVSYYPDEDPLLPFPPDYGPDYYPPRYHRRFFYPLYYHYPYSPYYGRYPYSPYYGRYPYSPYYPYYYNRYFYPYFYGPRFPFHGRKGGYGYLSYVSPKRSK